jgi:hypothetical protein
MRAGGSLVAGVSDSWVLAGPRIGSGRRRWKKDCASSTIGWLLVVWGLSLGFVVGCNVPVIAYIPFIIVGVIVLRKHG